MIKWAMAALLVSMMNGEGAAGDAPADAAAGGADGEGAAGGARGDAAVGAADGEGVVCEALGDGATGEAGGEESVAGRPDAIVGSSGRLVSGQWVWLVVWCLAWAAEAEYLRCACWSRRAGGAGLSACWRWVALWSWCPRWALACMNWWVPLCVAVAVGVGALGAWWAWLGVGARVDALFAWAVWGLWAVRLLLPSAWRLVLCGEAWLVCALRGWCGACPAWVVPARVVGVGCLVCVTRVCGGLVWGAWRCGRA